MPSKATSSSYLYGTNPPNTQLGREVLESFDLMLGSDGEKAGRGGTFRADFKNGWVEAHRTAREILEGDLVFMARIHRSKFSMA